MEENHLDIPREAVNNDANVNENPLPPWQRNRNQQNNVPDNNPIEQWYREVPPITKYYTMTTAVIALSLQFGYITPYQMYYHPNLVIFNGQIWRLLSTFLYFGPFGIDFLFHTFFMMRYFRSLEESWYRGKQAEFSLLLIVGGCLLLILGPIFGMVFLGPPLVFMMVYIWGRRNPYLMMSFLGLFTFTAPYLPWVLLGFSLIISKSFPLGDFIGILVGHIYYFLEDILPRTHGYRVLNPPIFLKRLFGEYKEVQIQDTDEDSDTTSLIDQQ
jgi:Derlin-2/3